MVYTLRFFSLKCSLFHNSNLFGSCIIHILYTECAKIKKNNSGAKRLTIFGVNAGVSICTSQAKVHWIGKNTFFSSIFDTDSTGFQPSASEYKRAVPFFIFYAFFRVIPRRLNFISRRFGTLSSS